MAREVKVPQDFYGTSEYPIVERIINILKNLRDDPNAKEELTPVEFGVISWHKYEEFSRQAVLLISSGRLIPPSVRARK